LPALVVIVVKGNAIFMASSATATPISFKPQSKTKTDNKYPDFA